MSSIFFAQLLLATTFSTVVFLHLIKKNIPAVLAYGIQSLAVVLLLFGSFLESKDIHLFFVIILTLLVKVILTPIFFIKLIKKHQLTFSVSTYLNAPLTLVVIVALTALAHSEKFIPLTMIITNHQVGLALALSTLFCALFLIVNRKGALSQALGILSLENSIVAFAIIAGLEESPLLQIGIIFDMLIWFVIANVFISMMYQQFKSLDTSLMKKLRD